ncbi:MAG: aminotransferase [Chloroflexota bacterium]
MDIHNQLAGLSNFEQYDTQDIWRKDRDHVIHPWADFSVFKEKGSLVVAESEGAYIYDADGNKYLDGIGGIWCVNIGYGREEMADAVAKQVMRLTYSNPFVDMTSPPSAELGAKLAQLFTQSHTRAYNHVFFGTGGSMANDTAIRMVHFYFNQLGKPTKKHVISRYQAYHGSTYLAMSLTGVTEDHVGFDVISDWIHYVSAPYTYRRPDGMTVEEFCDFLVDELEQKILEIGPENTAAFIAEPIMGAGGVIVPPAGYHRRTQEVCRKYDVLYISDEVVTGFGRLGHFFASEPVFDIQPDIITSAKGLTSGYLPLSATILSDEVYDVISVPQAEGAYFYHGFTYTGHPVACAAALQNIQIMEDEKICEHVQVMGPYFEEQLKTLLDVPIVGDVRGSHFMLCIESVADKETKAEFDASVGIGERIADHCQERGLLVRPIGACNVLSPPLILNKGEIDHLVDVLRESMLATMDDLVREGLY